MKHNEMLNFAVGPVMMSENIRSIGAEQIPYFRTSEFSQVMFENEKLFKKMLNAPENARAVFITGSGTASMEVAIINTLSYSDKVLIINGGSFGQRFCDICSRYNISYDAIVCEYGKTLTAGQLAPYDGGDYTAFIMNLGETSTGVLYDLNLISDFCKKNNLLLIVDAVSSFLCDEIDFEKNGIDVVITGSQKALALAPGLSLICLSTRAIDRIRNNQVQSLYFDLKLYLKDGERGQTPFTPAVGILLQLNARLKAIESRGGAKVEINKAKDKADYFRMRVDSLGLNFFADKKSNAVTSLTIKDNNKSAYKVFEVLKDHYNIWVCPNGGELRDKVFRVGHMGELNYADYDRLISALKELKSDNLI